MLARLEMWEEAGLSLPLCLGHGTPRVVTPGGRVALLDAGTQGPSRMLSCGRTVHEEDAAICVLPAEGERAPPAQKPGPPSDPPHLCSGFMGRVSHLTTAMPKAGGVAV